MKFGLKPESILGIGQRKLDCLAAIHRATCRRSIEKRAHDSEEDGNQGPLHQSGTVHEEILAPNEEFTRDDDSDQGAIFASRISAMRL